ncbi:hypothetical protein HQ584_02265, partial [Patescibacteria group bacterium]|nr:hypothetical protein [Patescibacteria group bacterium]
MKSETIIKIDLCKSKIFSQKKEDEQPNIRKIALEKLLDASSEFFPYSNEKYPNGSYYKADGDAVFYILEKPTVAIRASIEFMKKWYYEGLGKDFPECRIIIHRGNIDTTDSVPEGIELVGKVFEEISVLEKKVDDGKIFVSEDVRKKSDLTITKFVDYGRLSASGNKKVKLYYLAFDDPRTFKDDSLAHLLFVAHVESVETRSKIFRFFIIEYIIENEKFSDLYEFAEWCKSKGYPTIPQNEIQGLLQDREYFSEESIEKEKVYKLKGETISKIKEAQKKFSSAEKTAIGTVKQEILNELKDTKAVELFNIKRIMDEYLCGIFSEIRMMANYFRNTFKLYDTSESLFKPYDYIVDRHLFDLDESTATRWKKAFIKGLKKVSETENVYIAAIFYNILAGYYLNRSFQTSPYQIEKLKERQFFIDTNILYSIKCEASSYFEQVNYFLEKLKHIGLELKIFPFSIAEYEKSLETVETEYKKDPYSSFLIYRKPWLYQEFNSKPQLYMNRIEVCRELHSITKGKVVDDNIYSDIDKELKSLNASLEISCVEYDEDEIKSICGELRTAMLSETSTMEGYWKEADKIDFRPEIIEHDAKMIKNVEVYHKNEGNDELGPRVLLLTTDNKLIKCRKEYPFIISTLQFVEFMLPYLFLGEIPIEESNKIPNKILSAQLGVHISFWEPSKKDVISMFLNKPELLKHKHWYGAEVPGVSTTLNDERFKKTVEKSTALSPEEKDKLADLLLPEVEEAIDLQA